MKTGIQEFPPLELVNKPNVDTAHAAYGVDRIRDTGTYEVALANLL